MKTREKDPLESLSELFIEEVNPKEDVSYEEMLESAQKLLEELIELSKTDRKKTAQVIVNLHRYYMYMNEHEISSLLTKYLDGLTDAEIRVNQNKWIWYDEKKVEIAYQKILTIRRSNGKDRARAIKNLSVSLEDKTIKYLVPIALLAKKNGDAENESWILRFIWKKSKNDKILDRLSEVCGYQVTEDVSRVNCADRGKWISEKLSKCQTIKSKSKIHPDHILSVKKIYTLQPYNEIVLDSLIRIDAKVLDKDVMKMLSFSLSRVSYYVSIGRLLSKALFEGSSHATKILVERIFRLGWYETILHSIGFVNYFGTPRNKHETKDLILFCLDCYERFVPEFKKNNNKFLGIQSNYYIESYKQRPEFKEWIVRRYKMGLFEKKDYVSLFQLLDSKTVSSAEVAEVILLAALDKRDFTRVIEAYKLLVSIDQAFASYYNAEVESYFMIANRHLSKSAKKRTSNSLVSNIWGVPANFSKPVNSIARKLSWFNKE